MLLKRGVVSLLDVSGVGGLASRGLDDLSMLPLNFKKEEMTLHKHQ